MKTMTCTALGGPCDLAHSGETADDIIKAQDEHLKDAVQTGDSAHEPARREKKGAGAIRSSRWVGTRTSSAVRRTARGLSGDGVDDGTDRITTIGADVTAQR